MNVRLLLNTEWISNYWCVLFFYSEYNSGINMSCLGLLGDGW
jgi:hypothetical protein